MTEGIIQKVFQKFIDNVLARRDGFRPSHFFEIAKLQQELIAEIKKEFRSSWLNFEVNSDAGALLRKLIGDTE